MHSVNDNKSNSDVNTKAVLGILHADMECAALNKLRAYSNIPTISPTLYSRYERKIGPTYEASAKGSYKRTAAEEHQLVMELIDNIEKSSREP